MNGGSCCKFDEDCEMHSICSQDNPLAPYMFKYMACPNEQGCGDKYIKPKLKEVTYRRIDNNQYNFLIGDVCSYTIQ